jgi:uncharacterized integral membrane protein (TIGR00698 family)
VAAFIAAAAMLGSLWAPARQAGLGALTLAMFAGLAIANLPGQPITSTGRARSGLDFCGGTLLRAGIVLYGLRVSFQDIAAVGLTGALIAVAVVGMVFGAAMYIGPRWLGLDRRTCALIGAGSAICGAAAVMATQPVVRGESRDASVAVATVVGFGTLSMLAFPLAFPLLGMPEHAFGLYLGSTVHEVAQVVAAGEAVSPAVAQIAVIEKMLRVMLLAPFLFFLSYGFPAAASATGEATPRPALANVPWFAVLFIVVAGINSLRLVPPHITAALLHVDTFILGMAMAAIGMKTRLVTVLQAGPRPHVLAGALFTLLLLGGYAINRIVPLLLIPS